jgi:hypothetical protein
MKKLLLTILMTAACLATARAAISVGPGGSTTFTFPARPTVAEGWSSLGTGSGSGAITDSNGLVTAVQAIPAASVNAETGSSGTTPPSEAEVARFNTTRQFVQIIPTTIAATLLMATLQNDTGTDQSSVRIDYLFGNETTGTVTEEVPGQIVFWSLTGNANEWTVIPQLAGDATGPRSVTFNVGNWPSGAPLYILWADDNAAANRDDTGTEEGGYFIDNVFFSPGNVTPPLIVTLNSPTNSVLVAPANVVVSATTSGGAAPATSVSFFTNGVLFVSDAVAPYSNQLVNLPAGTYAVHAEAVNGVDPTAYSATNIVVVRGEFIDYVSGTSLQNFDGMTATGIVTPQGWWVGAAAAGTAQFVTVNDGSAGPSGSSHGVNYGLTGDGDRALGSAPTGGDRNTVARIRNVGSSNITSFNLFFDAEQWRTHNTNTHIEYLTNYVSFDLGATWIPTTFLFQSPPDVALAPASTALDGNQAIYRTAGLGGSVVPPTPVPPGAVIYIRWNNFNDAGTDGAIAIDNFSFEATGFSPAVHFVNITSPTQGQTVSGGCTGTTNLTVSANASFTTTNVAFSLDGGAAVNDSTAPYSVTFPSVGLGSHTITATARDSSGAVAVTNVTFTVVGNVAPTIAFTNVYSLGTTGLTFQVGTPVTNQFGITDSDGTIASVEFFVNGTLHYSTNFNFGQIIVNNLLLGTNTFLVRATDNCGGVSQASQLVVGTAPGGSITLILTNGSLWKYDNNGVQPPNDGQGDAWYSPLFDDLAWLSGYTEIGGGDAVAPPNNNTERTPINIGPANARFSAIYFRKTFVVADPSAFGTLIVQSLHDDGSAVYLNGTLVASFNMTNEVGVPFAYTDLADGATPDDGTRYYSSNIVNSLIVGVNTLAVEVHQSDTGSSDLSFDLMLWGAPSAGPTLTINQISPTQVEISWPLSTPPGPLLYSTTDLNPPVNWTLETAPNVPSGGFNRVTVNTGGVQKYWTLRQ